MWLNIIGHYLIRQNSKRGISCPARHTLHSKGGPQSPTPNIKELPVAEVCRVFSSIASWQNCRAFLGDQRLQEGREGKACGSVFFSPHCPISVKGQAASKAFQVKDPSTLGPEKHPNQPPQQMLIEISSILAPPAVNQHCSKNSHPKDKADVAHSLGCRKAKKTTTHNCHFCPKLPTTPGSKGVFDRS